MATSAWAHLPVSLNVQSQPSSRSSSGQLPTLLEREDPDASGADDANDLTFGAAADGMTADRAATGTFAGGTFVAMHRSQAGRELGVGRMSPVPPVQAVGAERSIVAVADASRQREVSTAAVFDRAPSPPQPPPERASEMTPADSVLRASPFLQDLLDRCGGQISR